MSVDSSHTVDLTYDDDVVECEDMPDASDHPEHPGHDNRDMKTAIQLHLKSKSVIA